MHLDCLAQFLSKMLAIVTKERRNCAADDDIVCDEPHRIIEAFMLSINRVS